MNWEEKGFKLRQETRFPEQPGTALVVTAARSGALAMRLRIPSWLQSAPTVKLNGKVLDASAAPGSYLTLNRTWKTGDRVEMELPMHLTMESTPDNPNLQAYLYGPLVLAGDLGSEGLTEQLTIGPNAPRVGGGRPSVEIPTFKAGSRDVASWIKPADKPLTFRTTGQSKDVTMAPLNLPSLGVR